MPESAYTLFTDGAAKGNPGPAGWCWWAAEDSWAAGGWETATNNIAELTAAEQALLAVRHDLATPLTIITDSRYVIDCVTKYIHVWMRNGWMTSKKTPVANADLINRIHHLSIERGGIQWEWLKGHSGAFGNTQADEGASNAALSFQNNHTCPTGPGWPTSVSPSLASAPTATADVPFPEIESQTLLF